MASRLGLDGTEWAPRTGAEWKIGEDTSFVVSGLVQGAISRIGSAMLPRS